MLPDRIKQLREQAGLSQSELARRLDVTRSSVNAWEMGLSAPTTQYIVAMTKIFHVTADFLLGLSTQKSLVLDGYSAEEIELLYQITAYFDSKR